MEEKEVGWGRKDTGIGRGGCGGDRDGEDVDEEEGGVDGVSMPMST